MVRRRAKESSSGPAFAMGWSRSRWDATRSPRSIRPIGTKGSSSSRAGSKRSPRPEQALKRRNACALRLRHVLNAEVLRGRVRRVGHLANAEIGERQISRRILGEITETVLFSEIRTVKPVVAGFRRGY